MNNSELWDEVIKHWEEVVEDPANTLVGSSSCAFCREYMCMLCRGCPISEYTDNYYCIGTPYDSFTDEQTALISIHDTHYIQTLKQAAQDELDFLLMVRKLQESVL